MLGNNPVTRMLKDLKWRNRNLGIQKTDYGTKLRIKSFMDHLVFKEIFIDKVYDKFIHLAFEQVSENHESKRIIDLGGNLGFFTIRCCEIWNELKKESCLDFLIFEPSLTCFGRLEENLHTFDRKPFSFDTYNKLAGKKIGWDWFIEDEENHLGQCISGQIEESGKRYTRKVKYHDLSEGLEGSTVDLLKCDIEGSEIEFIKNYKFSLQNTHSIIIETHSKSGKNFIKENLLELGFENFTNNSMQDEKSVFSNLFFVKSS